MLSVFAAESERKRDGGCIDIAALIISDLHFWSNQSGNHGSLGTSSPKTNCLIAKLLRMLAQHTDDIIVSAAFDAINQELRCQTSCNTDVNLHNLICHSR